MYAPSNSLVNILMRWPALAAVGSTIAAVGTTGLVHDVAVAITGAIGGVLTATKLFHKQVCDCEGKGYRKISSPKVDWIIEYEEDHGHERPWKVYSIFGGLDYTKQHYASYATEEAAQEKIDMLRGVVEKIEGNRDED